MPANWKTGFEPRVILEKFESIRTVEGDNASFGGFAYFDFLAVLKSMVEIDDDISLEIAQRLVTKGLHEAAKNKNFKVPGVLSAINKAIKRHLSKPSKNYYLLTTLNIRNSNVIPKASINGCNLSFHKTLPKKYKKSRKEAINVVSSWLIEKDESFSCFVTVSTNARTEYDAANKMLDALDLLRGIWNLHNNKVMTISSSGRKKPVNQIILGALQSLHNSDGSIAADTYWYQPEHFKNLTQVDFSKNEYKSLKFTKKIRTKIRASHYKKEVETGIIRYVRALDYQDYNVSFLKLWSVLEYLTATLHDGYTTTIRRTAFHFKDREYVIQVLEHLRQYRNRSVHSGSGEDNIDVHLYQLKRHVEQLLIFHIGNHYKFSCLSEAGRFMDLPPDVGDLKKQISLLEVAVKYRSG